MTSAGSLIVTKQPLWVSGMACYPNLPSLVDKFTLESRFGDIHRLYKLVGDKIMVPRGVCPPGQQDLRVRGLKAGFDNINFVPRNERQAKAVSEAIDLLKEDQSFVFEAPTGEGKTVCTMPMIAAVGRVTLIVVHKTDLMIQWRKALKTILGLEDKDIGKIQGDVVDVAGRKVVLGMLQSLSKLDRYPAWVRENFGLIVFDEVHHLAAEVFMRVAGMFPAMLRLGLSATPKRADHMEIAFFAHIGPVRVRIATATAPPPKVLRVTSGWKCPRKSPGATIPHAAGKDMHVKKILSKNNIRNSMIVRVTKSAWDKGRCIVVFTDFIEHAVLLHHAFVNAGVTPHEIGLYVGDTTITKIADRQTELAKQIVVTTFGMMAEGTDKPSLDTCVLTMPRSNVKQAIGRVLRLHDGKQPPVVIDFNDDDSPVFKGYGRARLKLYAEIGAEVIPVSV